MKTVGIVGCQPRIGTTTQALQLTLCLMHMGYNAAYVEMGERDYIEKLDALYQGITIDKNDIIYCQSIPLYTGNPVTIASNICFHYFLCMSCGNLQSHSFIAVMESRNRLGGNKLKQNRISCIQPSEHIAKNTENHHISCKHIRPDGAASFIRYIKGNKIRSACRCISS